MQINTVEFHIINISGSAGGAGECWNYSKKLTPRKTNMSPEPPMVGIDVFPIERLSLLNGDMLGFRECK